MRRLFFWVSVVFAIGFGLFSFLLSLSAVNAYRIYSARHEYDSREFVVTGAHYSKGSHDDSPSFWLEGTVDGQNERFISSRLRQLRPESTGEILAEYPVGTVIEVEYNPRFGTTIYQNETLRVVETGMLDARRDMLVAYLTRLVLPFLIFSVATVVLRRGLSRRAERATSVASKIRRREASRPPRGPRATTPVSGMRIDVASSDRSPASSVPDPDRLRLRQGFTVLRAFFGCVFGSLGVALLIGAVWMVVDPGNEATGNAPGFFRAMWRGMGLVGAAMMGIVGLIFSVVGGSLLLGRAVIVIDRRAKTVTDLWMIWTPLGPATIHAPTRTLRSPRAVLAVREQMPAPEGERSWLFAVEVECEGGRKIPLMRYSSDQSCSAVVSDARRVARFLSINLVDSRTQGSLYRSSPEGTPLVERLAREGAGGGLPPEPTRTRVRYSREGDAIGIEIPKPGLGLPDVISAVVGFGLPAAISFWLFHMLSAGFGPGEKFLFTAFAGIMGLALMLMFRVQSLMRSTTRERIDASPRKLEVERRGFLVAATLEARTGDVLRISIERRTAEQHSPHVIMLESRDGALCFGEHLSADERRWIVAVLKRTLALAAGGTQDARQRGL